MRRMKHAKHAEKKKASVIGKGLSFLKRANPFQKLKAFPVFIKSRFTPKKAKRIHKMPSGITKDVFSVKKAPSCRHGTGKKGSFAGNLKTFPAFPGKAFSVKNLKNIPVFRIILYLLIATTVVSGVTLSRYTTTLSGEQTARAARFDYKINITDPGGWLSFSDIDVTLAATAKLSDAANCDFDHEEVSTVRKFQFYNQSEVSVKAQIEHINLQMDKGIMWLLLSEHEYVNHPTYQDVINKLYGWGGIVPTNYWQLRMDIEAANQQTINEWNMNHAYLDPNAPFPKELAVIFWAEYEGVAMFEPGYIDDFLNVPYLEDIFKLTFAVEQVD